MSESASQITGELVSRGPLIQTVLMKAFLEPHGWDTESESDQERIFYAPDDDVRVEQLIESFQSYSSELGIADLFENETPTMAEVLQGLSKNLSIEEAQLTKWMESFEPPDEYQGVDVATSIEILRAFGQASNIIRAEEMGAYWYSKTHLDCFGGHALVASEMFHGTVGTQRIKDTLSALASSVDEQDNDAAADELSAFIAHITSGVTNDQQQADILRRLANKLEATAEDVIANSIQAESDDDDEENSPGPTMG